MDEDRGPFEDYHLDIANVLPYEAYSDTKARQRASILWLVSKAYNHRIPSDLREPCYRDHEGEERLKPQIIHSLSNAELYCLALANIYADPNYHSLNHHGVLQILMRKGVDVIEPPDASLTETVLVQTAPIRMSAHMAVIESIMALYIKEVLIPEKVVEVVRRFSVLHSQSELPADAEDAALFWINKSCIKMRHRIEEELGTCRSPDEGDLSLTGRHVAPSIPLAQDLNDLSDGCCLAALLCFYCPGYLHWQDVRLSDSSSLADSVYNLQLVQRFCQEYLPHDIHFLSLEDFIYLHSSVRQNVLALIADLMYLFEIRPAKCVSRPGFKEETDHGLVLEAPKKLNQNGQPPQVISKPRSFHHTRSPIPDLRSGAFGGSNCSLPDINRASPHSNGNWQQRERITGKHKRISAIEGAKPSHQPPLRRANSMTDSQRGGQEPHNPTQCVDRLEEDEELAGYFSHELSSIHGDPRHRRISGPATNRDVDQVTEPLFPTHVKVLKEKNNHDTKRQERGEDYIMPLGTNLDSDDRPDSERAHGSNLDLSHEDEEALSNQMLPLQSRTEMDEDDIRIKAGLQDYYSQLGTEHPKESDIYDIVPENRTLSNEKLTEGYDKEKAMLEISDPYDISLYNEVKNMKGHNLTTSFADLCKLKKSPSSSINIVYMQMNNNDGNIKPPTKSNPGGGGSESGHKESEQDQGTGRSTPHQTVDNSSHGEGDSSIQSQMYNIRLKLEERRKKIEKEKKKVENIYRHQRQRLGKAAFLQAVTKGTVSEASTPDSSTSKELPLADIETEVSQEIVQDIADDLNMVKKQWFLQNGSEDGSRRREVSENGQQGVNAEEFQSSIEQLNSSLTDLQGDIASLSSQQDMIKKMMNAQPPQLQQEGKFFLHEQQNRSEEDLVPAGQGSWRNQPYSHLADTPTSPRRGQWGQPVMQMAEQSPQRQHWQPAPPVMRPASVEPQMMSGHPMTMQAQQYDQRPPSAVPFMETNRQGFSLQPVRSEMYPRYDYGYQPHSLYHNGPMENVPRGQYGYGQYPSLPNNSYNSLQNVPPDHYGSMMYPAQPQPLHAYPQNQQHPFHLQQEAAHSLNIPPTSQYQPPPQPITRVPPEATNQQFEQPVRTDSNTSHTETVQEDVTAVADEFGRPVGAVRMSSSPPNKPVLGKTFRIPKPKVTSPPLPATETPVTEPEPVTSNPTQSSSDSADIDKGFYISFDDNQPRKPKPKLRPRQVKARQQQRRAEMEAANGDKDAGLNSPQTSPNNAIGDTSSPSTESIKASIVQKDGDGVVQPGVGFVIGADFVSPNPDAEIEMARRKEMIMMMSLRRRADQESKRLAKEQEYAWQREQERAKKETQEKKKEEEKLRRQLILEQYRQRKLQEEAEKEGGSTGSGSKDSSLPSSRTGTLTRPKTRSASASRPRPKSIHVGSGSHDSLASNLGTGTAYHDDTASVHSLDIPSPRKPASGTTRHLLSPTQSSGHFPGSQSHAPLPLNLLSARYKGSGPPSDGASDTNSTTSSVTAAEYTGPKLFVKPTTKSNRGIIVNAINTVLAGAVNSETKKRVLEEINRSESKHFLILFRDAGCQYRAIYSYNPETEEVFKLNGIGPKAVTDHMMDRFFKYNSGGKCFTEVHTKHLTVTIDAFTIHNSLWSGKRVVAPKKDFF